MKGRKAIGLLRSYRTRRQSYLAVNTYCSSKQRKNGGLSVGSLPGKVLGTRPHLAEPWAHDPIWQSLGSATPAQQGCGVGSAASVNPKDRASNQRGLFPRLKILRNLPCQVLDFLGTRHPILPSDSPFWNGNVCLMSVPPLYFGNTQLIWFFRFTAGDDFCLRLSCTSSLTHI